MIGLEMEDGMYCGQVGEQFNPNQIMYYDISWIYKTSYLQKSSCSGPKAAFLKLSSCGQVGEQFNPNQIASNHVLWHIVNF